LRITIFNYGAGNLYSIQAALKKEGVEPRLTRGAAAIQDSDAILLPGVGSFTQATKKLPMKEIRDAVRSGKPLLGICLGLQLFFGRSEEGPGKGLSLLKGKVERLPSTVKVPQIGWNTLKIKNASELAEGLSDESWVYYVHSYYPLTDGPWVTATSEYGVEYASLVAWKNIYGTQFHPEKSGRTGRTILRNFLRSVRR
jgi:glutamine amidotransferase